MKKEEYRSARNEFAEKTIDELIELLSSESLRTRFLAEICLRDATST